MKTHKVIEYINAGIIDEMLTKNLGISQNNLSFEKERIKSAVRAFADLYGEDRNISVFSVGGRSEISGNHTDHNLGKVIAASVNLSIIAVAAQRCDGIIKVKSEGFEEDTITPDDAKEPKTENRFKSSAIIAGLENAFLNRSLNIGGFDAYTVSNVLKGSGLSSSAAFEVCIAKILSSFYNEDKIGDIELASMSKYAENEFFGKPCGLMDQASCAVGGLITVDFKNADAPEVKKLSLDINQNGYDICIVNTGANHADLNDDYAKVPLEMKKTAELLGCSHLRETTKEAVLQNADIIRAETGDRALLRALHFFDENERVSRQITAAENNDIETFLAEVTSSGNSSYKYLQNVYTPANVCEQGVSFALYLADDFLGKKGAVRVHGGGFAGTIQAFVPHSDTDAFKEYMERFFGKGSCLVVSVRKKGAVKIL